MPPSVKISRHILIILLALIGLSALGGGYYGMSGARQVPVEWLSGSGFRSYFIPGAFLFCMGGLFLFTAFYVWLRKDNARSFALACGALLMLWIIVQVSVIGYVSWLQPTMFVSGVVVILLAWQMELAAQR